MSADFPYERDVDARHQSRTESYRRETDRFALALATRVAEAIVDELRPVCDRIEIAGSIRRRSTSVKDVKILAIPAGLSRDLFGNVTVDARVPLDDVLERLAAEGRLRPRLTAAGVARMGRRYKALEAVRAGLPVDLFLVLPPSSWGAQLAIRTGPRDFSTRLVTECQRHGLRCVDGRLVDRNGRDVTTPEETDFFRACGVPYAEPWER